MFVPQAVIVDIINPAIKSIKFGKCMNLVANVVESLPRPPQRISSRVRGGVLNSQQHIVFVFVCSNQALALYRYLRYERCGAPLPLRWGDRHPGLGDHSGVSELEIEAGVEREYVMSSASACEVGLSRVTDIVTLSVYFARYDR